MPQMATFLMFEGNAEEALRLYVSALPDASITALERYGEDEDGPAGTVKFARAEIMGAAVLCIDSPIKHAFSFTPSTSLHITCDTADEVDALFATLSEGGAVMMPLDAYPFSPRYAWFNDRFGVSWQLMLRPD